jgi:hypothetical protein
MNNRPACMIIIARHESGDRVRWFIEHAYVIVAAQAVAGRHLAGFSAVSATPAARLVLGRAGNGETLGIRHRVVDGNRPAGASSRSAAFAGSA